MFIWDDKLSLAIMPMVAVPYNCVDVWEKKKDKWKLKLLDKKKKVE